ncbi:MAG TPA: tripartite tricarboxylate transporter TctB family protein [Jiangellaceae bacterium]|nr:tripartite tricarboxylate transporter TctB family protein [Jiangellaceae bacterium]
MTSETAPKGQGRSELGVALFLLALGVLVLADAARIPQTAGQTGPIGPKAVPYVLGAALVVLSVLLAIDVLRGGRGEQETGEDIDLSHGTDWRTVLILIGAFLANVVLIERVGWPVSGAILFFGVAFALGSRHFIRDPLIAIALSIGTWYLFALGLGIELPVGVLKGIL